RRLVVLGELGRVDVRRRAAGGRKRESGENAGAPPPGAGDGDADPLAAGAVLVQPSVQVTGCECGTLDLEALVRLRLRGLQRLVEPVAQHPKLQRVEKLVD